MTQTCVNQIYIDQISSCLRELENLITLLTSSCDKCKCFGVEATSIAFPKRLCRECGIAEETRVLNSLSTCKGTSDAPAR